MDHPFCVHVLCLCMKYMHEKSVVHYSSVCGKIKKTTKRNKKFQFFQIYKTFQFLKISGEKKVKKNDLKNCVQKRSESHERAKDS